MSPTVSVIVPIFNPGPKFQRCLMSLTRLRKLMDIQVVLVDDHSSDGTFRRIEEFANSRDWVIAERLPSNSGSPSTPRNVGLRLSDGEYIIYLDADDQILPDGAISAIDVARQTGADFVRAPLVRRDAGGDRVMNTIDGWQQLRTRRGRAEAIVRFHSTTPTAVFSRKFLVDNELVWPSELHLAEDAVFLYESLVLGKVEYSKEPLYIYDARPEHGQTSATQRYEDSEMLNHVVAWSRAQRILEQIGIDFFAVRGQVALQSAIESMIENNQTGFSRTVFRRFGDLLRNHSEVADYIYRERVGEVRDHILKDRYDAFLESIKQRVVIAGHDMKFIEPAVSRLKEVYAIKYDEWSDHDRHDETRSQELLAWADIVFCEWMLGNAIWYSERKLPHQRLYIRVHRFELNKPYGLDIVIENVERFIVIAPALMDELQLSFNVPRTKIVYRPNYLAIDQYVSGDDPGRVHRLAMVGIVPKLKGLDRALKVLAELREYDPNYTLTLFGRHPSELPWVASDPDEVAYYQRCKQYIDENGLGDAVKFDGWVDTRNELAKFGFVLSMSDIEGSHVSATEIFFAGGVGVFRKWPGVAFLYPEEFIFSNRHALVDFILSCRNLKRFQYFQELGRNAMTQLYESGN